MNIADAVNPFYFRLDTDPVRSPATKLITKGGLTTIYSAFDMATIASATELSPDATIVPDEYDLIVHGLDVVLASDLLHQDRGPEAARSIRIFCRRLIVLEGENGLTVDVSADVDERRRTPVQPDVALPATGLIQHELAAHGDDIAYALDNRSAANPWTQWFTSDPGSGWGQAGACGGRIEIACETLELHGKLYLKANGAPGNAGVGGQNVKGWIPGVSGGNAGKGGRGGDSGEVVLTVNRVVDGQGQPVDLEDWVEVECEPGEPGKPGRPGFAYDPLQQNRHFGDYAPPGEPGQGKGATVIEPSDLDVPNHSNEPTTTDLSEVARNLDLHYWGLLYHRIKLDYLRYQPMGLHLPSATDGDWIKLGRLIKWGSRLGLVYGATDDGVRDAAVSDVTQDEQFTRKVTIARAMMLMATNYMAGTTVWGRSVTTVEPRSFEALCEIVDENFIHQAAVRNFFIEIRTELADAVKANQALTTMRNSADYAVRMHEASVRGLKEILFGSSDKGGVDANSLLGALNAADASCNVAIEKLAKDLDGLDAAVNDAIGIGVNDVLESIKSICFVVSDPPALAGMVGAEGLGLYQKAVNDITDDVGNSYGKDVVIKRLHQLKGDVSEFGETLQGLVANEEVGRMDAMMLASLDTLDDYVSQFTKALGDVGADILAEIDQLRQKVNFKNDLWLEYNERLHQLAMEWDDYVAAKAKKQEIDTSSQQDLTASLIDAVQLYTLLYLANLERSADLWAKLVRKFAYVTLDADLPREDFIGSVTTFWGADAAAARGIADRADGNWSINQDAVVGAKNSDSIRSRLGDYNAGVQSIVLQAPDPEVNDKKSTFYVSIDASRGGEDETVVRSLLRHHAVWIQVVPADFEGKYTEPSGRHVRRPFWIKPGADAEPFEGTYPFPLVAGHDWDVRITHVNPWIEGVATDSKQVQFDIKLGTRSYIMDDASSAIAHYVGYGNEAVVTQFTHWTDALVSDETNARMSGGGSGRVTDPNIDKRGIYMPVKLGIPRASINAGLRAAKSVSDVKLRIHFRVIFRASKRF